MRQVKVMHEFSRGRRSLTAGLVALVGAMTFFVSGAFADAGNPILGTINGKIVPTPTATYPDAVTVYVRGGWNWLSHNKDCNLDRNGTGVGIIWNDPHSPGYTVTKGSISAGVGVQSSDNGLNVQDEMVHPSDVGDDHLGNGPGRVTAAGEQQFVDAGDDVSPSPANFGSWRSGCGRPNISVACFGNAIGDPCGSWGYDKNLSAGGDSRNGGGQGYKHVYQSRADVQSVCVNFYDVHGSNAGFQAPKEAKEIDVNGNGDNSIQTNAFNVNQGANCIYFPNVTTQSTSGTPIDDINDAANVTGAPPNQSATLTFRVYSSLALCNAAGTGLARFAGGATSNAKTVTTSATGTASATSDNLAKPVPEGSYFWRVTFQTANADLVLSDCNETTEKSVVEKIPTDIDTGQKVLIQDFARVNGFFDGGQTRGTVTFRLYQRLAATSASCTNNGTDDKRIYTSPAITVAADGTANTPAAGQTGAPPSIPITQEPEDVNTTFDWQLTFSGDTVNKSFTSVCGEESFTLAGNEPGVDP
jgi:hypothetical protein